jgi:hypothetical protein
MNDLTTLTVTDENHLGVWTFGVCLVYETGPGVVLAPVGRGMSGTGTYIAVAPEGSPPARNPAILAGYGTPWKETFALPILSCRAWYNAGPTRKPIFPGSALGFVRFLDLESSRDGLGLNSRSACEDDRHGFAGSTESVLSSRDAGDGGERFLRRSDEISYIADSSADSWEGVYDSKKNYVKR